MSKPTAEDAARIVRQVLKDEPEFVRRFPTGLCHYVFDVATKTGKQVVVRIAQRSNRRYLEGAIRWSLLLKRMEVPLPDLIHADLDYDQGRLPFIVLERLIGTDLADVYRRLTAAQKQQIATQVVQIQRRVGTLSRADGFGHACSYETVPYSSWSAVIGASVDRSERWIIAAGVVDPGVVEPVRAAAAQLEPYFMTVKPVPFLDDTTTKNVIIDDEGRLSGIVDVDEICFGDSLLTPALTRMSLMARNLATDYIDYWCDALNISEAQRRALSFYTAMFCLNFLGEIGQEFNLDAPPAVNPQLLARLQMVLQSLLIELH